MVGQRLMNQIPFGLSPFFNARTIQVMTQQFVIASLCRVILSLIVLVQSTKVIIAPTILVDVPSKVKEKKAFGKISSAF